MNVKKNHSLNYILIFLGLFAALLPVILANNYLRQDDLMYQLWPGMKMSDFGYLYYNTVFQLVRPLCMLSFYITDLISINLHHSVYVRFCSMITISISAILLYRWQLLFKPNRLLATTFAICAFTLPSYQLFAATANYFLILFALLLTLISLFCFHYSYHNTTHTKKYFYLGCLLFIASLMEYPLSSMYAWTLLAIGYLNTLNNTALDPQRKKNFLFVTAKHLVYLMIFYYLLSRAFHHIFHVRIDGRSTAIHFPHIIPRSLQIFDMLSWHSAFWFWNTTYTWDRSPLWILGSLFVVALVRLNYWNHVKSFISQFKNILIVCGISFLLFFLAYSPIIAAPEYCITFRYCLATMPILLYVFFWSYDIIFTSSSKFIQIVSSTGLIALTLLGMGYANLMIADGIVGPHEKDFAYVQQQLSEKVVPLLKENKKVLIHAIDCEGMKNFHYPTDVPSAFEYGMRICQYRQQVVGVTLHSMMLLGYYPNYHRQNIMTDENGIVTVKDIPWGELIVTSDNKLSLPKNKFSVVTIDVRKAPPYQRFEFYKKLLARFA